MKKISLKDFALTGEFGPIIVGKSTKQDVIDLMGNDFDFGGFGEVQIIKYAWYEFFYWTKTGVLHAIQNDHLQYYGDPIDNILFKNDQIEIDTWFLKLNEDTTRSEVKSILKSENIPFTEEDSFEDKIMRLESGVTLDFDNRDGVFMMYEDGTSEKNEEVVIHEKEQFVLNGIRYFPNY